jgi:curli biogenesis system outer membrane secretion channel CsgG
MIQQSNCFVVVERGTGERSLKEETDRGRGGEARESGTRGKGQQVIADFLLVPEIVLSSQGNQGGSLSGIGKLLPGGLSGLAGQIGVSSGEASTVLRIVDIRSSVRLAAAEGYSKNKSFSFNGMVIVSSGGVGASGYSRTDEGRLISAAFFDAYKKMVVALREYKAQTVKGGLGEGGLLGVQGGITPASKALDTKPKPTPTPVPNPAPKK